MIKSFGRIDFDTESGQFLEESGRHYGDIYYDILYDPTDPKKNSHKKLGEILDRIYKHGQDKMRQDFKNLLQIKERF